MKPQLTRRQALAGAVGLAATTGTLGHVLSGEKAYPASFSKAMLEQDLEHWRGEVLVRHPRFVGQKQLDSEAETAFSAAAASIGSSLSRQEAFRIFAQINPLFRDAHTLLLPWLSGAEPTETERRVQFPFGVDIHADLRMRLRSMWTNSQSGEELQRGTELLAINGVASRHLISELARYGHGETALLRSHMLAVMLPEWLDAVMGWRRAFRLTVGGTNSTREIRWTTASKWVAKEAGGSSDLPALSWPAPAVALLHVPTFDVDEDPGTFERAIDKAFADIRSSKARQLIIDVRGNTGGQSDAGAKVIRYFLKKPVVQVSKARERLNADNNGLLGYRGAPGTMREFDLGEDQIEPVAPDLRFSGPVMVLIDEMTYSAGILFATTMQDHGLAVLAGRPTGGFANQTGNMMPSRLPNTGFTAFIATREFVRPSGDLRQIPVVPDIAFENEPTNAQLSDAMAKVAEQFSGMPTKS